MTGGYSQNERVMNAVLRDQRGLYAGKLPAREPTVSELIDRWRLLRYENDLDGNDLDMADEIRERIKADYDLTPEQIKALGEMLCPANRTASRAVCGA